MEKYTQDFELSLTKSINKAPHGWWLNWLKSAVAAAGALAAGDLGAAIGPHAAGSKDRVFGGGGGAYSICQL